MPTNQKVFAKGIKFLTIALPLLFIGPSVIYNAFMNKNNVWPYVNVYKYVVALQADSKKGLSSEEILYRKAELKYKLINLIERLMKEAAFDCPLNIVSIQ